MVWCEGVWRTEKRCEERRRRLGTGAAQGQESLNERLTAGNEQKESRQEYAQAMKGGEQRPGYESRKWWFSWGS
jgi:hypothetical protein